QPERGIELATCRECAAAAAGRTTAGPADQPAGCDSSRSDATTISVSVLWPLRSELRRVAAANLFSVAQVGNLRYWRSLPLRIRLMKQRAGRNDFLHLALRLPGEHTPGPAVVFVLEIVDSELVLT